MSKDKELEQEINDIIDEHYSCDGGPEVAHIVTDIVAREVKAAEELAEARGHINAFKWVNLHKHNTSFEELIETGIEHHALRLAQLTKPNNGGSDETSS